MNRSDLAYWHVIEASEHMHAAAVIVHIDEYEQEFKRLLDIADLAYRSSGAGTTPPSGTPASVSSAVDPPTASPQIVSPSGGDQPTTEISALRRVAQILIEQIGAHGPERAEDTARRAVISDLERSSFDQRDRLDRIRSALKNILEVMR